MSYVYVRQQQVVHQKSLPKGLPSNVDGSAAKYEVQRLKLPV